jgi:hypothetical protein
MVEFHIYLLGIIVSLLDWSLCSRCRPAAAFVKDKVFAGVEHGDLITAVNQRSKKEYQWRYRNMRKEGTLGHQVGGLGPFLSAG